MNTRFCVGMLSLVPLLLGISCHEGPRVLQGNVVHVENETQQLQVRDELAPHTTVRFEVQEAEVGGTFHEGDLVRIAYRTRGNVNAATRIMNLTRQGDQSRRHSH